ncbi:MAG: T9SS type A sorting domain-containing protein [Candidatus Margulisiibacteriota bacterium]
MKKAILLCLMSLGLAAAPVFAQSSSLIYTSYSYVIHDFFTAYQDTGSSSLVVYKFGYGILADENAVQVSSIGSSSVAGAELTGTPLVYPNPAKLSDVPKIGYTLTLPANIEIRIYDMLASEIYRKNFSAGQLNGGALGWNAVPLNRSDFNNFDLYSGVYFFLIINDGKVIGKGKFVVRP